MVKLSVRDRSRLLVVVAALLWSTSGLYAKAPWFDDWPMETRGVALTFWRAVFAALTVLPFVRRPQFRVAMIPMSMAFLAMTYSFLVAMVNGSETTTIWLQYVGPAWVVVAGLFGIGDRPHRSDWVMVGLSLVGIAFIIGMEARVTHESLVTGPVGLALFSGLMYAVVMLSLRRLRGVDVAWLGLVNHLVSVVCLAPLVIGKVPLPHGGQWIALFCLGAVQLAIPYMIFAWAVREVESNEASLLTLLEPVAVPIWTFIAWRSYPSYQLPRWWTLVGAALIAVGFIWRYGMVRRSNMSQQVPSDLDQSVPSDLDQQVPSPSAGPVSQED
ncbi:MAG: DMT family transporter [Rubripirellula sp.]|nr:DMT family transporter [Rubripirellula sp.]